MDFVLGDHEVAIEVKSTELANEAHMKGLRRFRDEYTIRRSILVSLDTTPPKTEDGIEIFPWKVFLRDLWNGRIL